MWAAGRTEGAPLGTSVAEVPFQCNVIKMTPRY